MTNDPRSIGTLAKALGFMEPTTRRIGYVFLTWLCAVVVVAQFISYTVACFLVGIPLFIFAVIPLMFRPLRRSWFSQYEGRGIMGLCILGAFGLIALGRGTYLLLDAYFPESELYYHYLDLSICVLFCIALAICASHRNLLIVFLLLITTAVVMILTATLLKPECCYISSDDGWSFCEFYPSGRYTYQDMLASFEDYHLAKKNPTIQLMRTTRPYWPLFVYWPDYLIKESRGAEKAEGPYLKI